MNQVVRVLFALMFLLLVLPLGCDDRATQIAIDAADRQATQNQELARLDREHASARKELIELHQQVQVERKSLSDGWQILHSEQQAAVDERRTESLVAKLVPVLLLLIAAGFVFRLVSRWLDFKVVETLMLVGNQPEQGGRITTPNPLKLKDKSSQPGDDRDHAE